jgi:hypothetical protein
MKKGDVIVNADDQVRTSMSQTMRQVNWALKNFSHNIKISPHISKEVWGDMVQMVNTINIEGPSLVSALGRTSLLQNRVYKTCKIIFVTVEDE